MTDLFSAANEPVQLESGSSAESAVTVSTVNQALRDVVEGAFLPLWIRGEVSDFKKHRSGHWYFSLRDGASQLRCVTWFSDQRRIPAPPDDGMQVAIYGQLTVYQARGDVQITVKKIEAAGDGLWLKAYQKTKAKLEKEGLLAAERKRPLPSMPKCIAVVTSPDGAALHDIVHVIRRRAPRVRVVLVPARVQGEGAAIELRAAVERAGRWRGADLLIIGRGGGAREDLWCFNDERLARAIALSPLPTISAVGHEVDTTICDLVADLRVATPSAAAEAAVPATADVGARLRSRAQYLRRGMMHLMRNRLSRLAYAARHLPQSATRIVTARDRRIAALGSRLNDLSPLAVMQRGYVIAQSSDAKTLSRAADFAPGSRFTLRLRDGSVEAIAEKVNPGPEKKDVV